MRSTYGKSRVLQVGEFASGPIAALAAKSEAYRAARQFAGGARSIHPMRITTAMEARAGMRVGPTTASSSTHPQTRRVKLMWNSIQPYAGINGPVHTITLGPAEATNLTPRGVPRQRLRQLSAIYAELSIGQPRILDLQNLLQAKALQPAPEIADNLQKYNYYLVEMNYSLVPSDRYPITSCRFRIEVITDQYPSDQTLVYDIYPVTIIQSQQNPHPVSVGTDFRFYEPDVLKDHQQLTLIYLPHISPNVFGIGRQTNSAIWMFRQQNKQPLEGLTVTYFVVQISAVHTSIKLDIGAIIQVTTPFANLPIVSLAKIVREQSTDANHILQLPIHTRSSKIPIYAADSELMDTSSARPLIFLSYSSQDSTFVQSLADDLERNGANIWYDSWNISVGDSIPDAVNDALKICTAILIILSPNSVTSDWVMAEASAAIMLGKRILPVLYQSCELPPLLARYRCADFTMNYTQGFDALSSEISSIMLKFSMDMYP